MLPTRCALLAVLVLSPTLGAVDGGGDEVGFAPAGGVAPPARVLRLGGPSLRFSHALSVHFPADGKTMLAGGWPEVREWSLATRQTTRLYRGEKWHAWDLTTTRDGKHLVVRDFDGDILVIDRATKAVVRRIPRDEERIQTFAVSPDGKVLAAGVGKGELRLWDLLTGKQRAFRASHPAPPVVPMPGVAQPAPPSPPWITHLAFSPDGKTIASSAMGDVVRGWDVATARQVWAFDPRLTRDGPIAFTPDGERLAVPTLLRPLGPEGRNGPCGYALWSVPKLVKGVEMDSPVGAYRVAFSPDGKLFAGGGGGCRLKVWDARTGREKFTAALGSSVSSLEFSRDSKLVACVAAGLGLWDAATGQEVLGEDGHTGGVSDVAVARDGKLVVTGGREGTVRVWDTTTGRQRMVLRGHEGAVVGVAISPDRSTVASVAMDGNTARLWDLTTGRERWRFRFRIDDQVGGLSFSPDGKTLAVHGGNLTGHLLDVAKGTKKVALVGYDGFGQNGGSAARFSPDGKYLAAPVRRGPGGGELPGPGVRPVPNRRGAIPPIEPFDANLGPGSEPDGKVRIALWDLGTGRRVRLLGPAGHHTGSFAFSPDGDLMAVGAYQAEETVVVNVKTGAIEQRLAAKGGWALAFTPDGRRLFAGAACFELRTGRKLFELPVQPRTLAVFPDGRKVAVVDSQDASAAIHDLAGR